MSQNEIYLLGTAVLLILCVLASRATERLGIPTLVVFLGIGALAGSEGIGQIEFNDASKAQSLGVLALAYILFSGGLDTKWSGVKPVLKEGLALATLGVLFTCGLIGAFVHFVIGLPWLDSLLTGAIVSSTDAGAVFTVLRSRNIHLKNNLRPLLEFESGSNDPMAIFLTTSILTLMQSPYLSYTDMIPHLFLEMIVGGLFGFFAGKVIVWMFNKVKLQIEGLYTVMSIAIVIFIYSATQALKGNGYLAVYIAGVVLGNHQFVFKKSLSLMHDGISWLMQSAMFLTLGLLIYPSQIISVSASGLLIAVFMIFIARPVSVYVSLFFSKLGVREKGLISWVGLRGSVPVVMATYPLVAGIDRGSLIFNLVFFVVLSSLIVQGTSVPFISRLLKVDDPAALPKKNYSSTPGHLQDIVTVEVPAGSPVLNRSLVDVGISHQNALIVAIERDGQVIIPRGSTVFEAHDKISVMADDDSLGDFVELLWVSKQAQVDKKIL
ncbi:MAG TPA: potassium/proton antiporter [Bacteriovoracaceae bacterium]|nr:potassium/proton antiporter [Bacteriovoracaceae bacterium]